MTATRLLIPPSPAASCTRGHLTRPQRRRAKLPHAPTAAVFAPRLAPDEAILAACFRDAERTEPTPTSAESPATRRAFCLCANAAHTTLEEGYSTRRQYLLREFTDPGAQSRVRHRRRAGDSWPVDVDPHEQLSVKSARMFIDPGARRGLCSVTTAVFSRAFFRSYS